MASTEEIMKPDMPKIITERPRQGARLKQPKGYKKEMSRIDDDSPSGEKIRQKWKRDYADSKQPSEHFGPFHRFLRGKIGERWDDVYSEICQATRDNQFHRHILDCLNSFVETNVFMVDGLPYYNYGILYGKPVTCYCDRYDVLYVHPDTGLLCESPKRKQPEKEPRVDLKRIDDKTIVKQIKGIWYKLTVAKFNDDSKKTSHQIVREIGNRTLRFTTEEYPAVYDVAHNVRIAMPHEAIKLYGECVYATNKEQLNSKEIKKLNLAT
jgi:hypothetical protein